MMTLASGGDGGISSGAGASAFVVEGVPFGPKRSRFNLLMNAMSLRPYCLGQCLPRSLLRAPQIAAVPNAPAVIGQITLGAANLIGHEGPPLQHGPVHLPKPTLVMPAADVDQARA